MEFVDVAHGGDAPPLDDNSLVDQYLLGPVPDRDAAVLPTQAAVTLEVGGRRAVTEVLLRMDTNEETYELQHRPYGIYTDDLGRTCYWLRETPGGPIVMLQYAEVMPEAIRIERFNRSSGFDARHRRLQRAREHLPVDDPITAEQVDEEFGAGSYAAANAAPQ